jgi:hypothetical protein
MLPNKIFRHRENVRRCHDEVFDPLKVVSESLSPPLIEFRKYIIEDNHGVARGGGPFHQIDLCESNGQCARPRLALTRVGPSGEIIENNREIVAVRPDEGCPTLDFLPTFLVKQLSQRLWDDRIASTRREALYQRQRHSVLRRCDGGIVTGHEWIEVLD